MSATALTTLCRETIRASAARFSRHFSRQSVASAGYNLAMTRDVRSTLEWIAGSADQAPLHEWQRQILDERLAAHRAGDANEARPWDEVLDRLEGRLRASSR